MPFERTSRARVPSMKSRVRAWDSEVMEPIADGTACRSDAAHPSSGPAIQNCSGPILNARTAPAQVGAPMAFGRSTPRTDRSTRSSSATVSAKAAACRSAKPRTSPILTGGFGAPCAADTSCRSAASRVKAERRSSTQTLSLGIEKHRRCDPRPHPLAAQREGTNDLLPDMSQAARVQAQRDASAELRRPGDRGHVAAAMPLDLVRGGEEDRAATQTLPGLEAFDADQRWPPWGRHERSRRQLPTDEGLFGPRHAAETQVTQREARIELRRGDVALLDAQRRQRLQTVGPHTQRCAAREQVLPECRTM